MSLMDWLRSSTQLVGFPSIQPHKAKVPVVTHKAQFVTRAPGMVEGVMIHVTTDHLTTGLAGATRPDAFVSVYGTPPVAPVIGQIGGIRGSNAPEGGHC